MKFAPLIAAAALAAPGAASAEVLYYSRVDTRPVIHDTLLVCADRNDELWHRKALLDEDKRDVDREADRLARVKEQLALEFTGLDTFNTGEVAAYNARSSELNRHVDAYNRRVAELNGASALLNADSAQMTAYCNGLYVARR